MEMHIQLTLSPDVPPPSSLLGVDLQVCPEYLRLGSWPSLFSHRWVAQGPSDDLILQLFLICKQSSETPQLFCVLAWVIPAFSSWVHGLKLGGANSNPDVFTLKCKLLQHPTGWINNTKPARSPLLKSHAAHFEATLGTAAQMGWPTLLEKCLLRVVGLQWMQLVYSAGCVQICWVEKKTLPRCPLWFYSHPTNNGARCKVQICPVSQL